MSLEFVNRICPNCKNPNYMVLLGDFSKTYKYKCMNCNRYFNDIDFEKEPPQHVWKNKCMNAKVDMVEVVRCEDCIYGDDFDCPAPLPTGYLCQKGHGSHTGDWFCGDGKRK